MVIRHFNLQGRNIVNWKLSDSFKPYIMTPEYLGFSNEGERLLRCLEGKECKSTTLSKNAQILDVFENPILDWWK